MKIRHQFRATFEEILYPLHHRWELIDEFLLNDCGCTQVKFKRSFRDASFKKSKSPLPRCCRSSTNR